MYITLTRSQPQINIWFIIHRNFTNTTQAQYILWMVHKIYDVVDVCYHLYLFFVDQRHWNKCICIISLNNNLRTQDTSRTNKPIISHRKSKIIYSTNSLSQKHMFYIEFYSWNTVIWELVIWELSPNSMYFASKFLIVWSEIDYKHNLLILHSFNWITRLRTQGLILHNYQLCLILIQLHVHVHKIE